MESLLGLGDDSLLEVVPTLVAGLGASKPEEEQIESLLQVAQLVDTSFGERATPPGPAWRAAGEVSLARDER